MGIKLKNRKKTRNFLLFLGFLISLTILLNYLKLYLKRHPTVRYRGKKQKLINQIVPYIYTLIFAIATGTLNFFGFKYLKEMFMTRVRSDQLTSVLSATIVVFFCFFYSEQIKNILEIYFNIRDIKITLNTNLIGYTIGRIIIISLLFFYVSLN